MSSHPVVSDTLRGRRSQHDVKPCVNLSEYRSHLGSTAQTHSITLTEDISSESLTVSFRSDIYIRIPHRKAITIPSPWMSNAKITNEPGCRKTAQCPSVMYPRSCAAVWAGFCKFPGLQQNLAGMYDANVSQASFRKHFERTKHGYSLQTRFIMKI